MCDSCFDPSPDDEENVPVPERVEAGAALLDERMPGWFNMIDVDTLKIFDPTLCVMGQLFGDYLGGLDTLDVDISAGYGFNAYDDEYTELDAAWRELILSRRGQLTTATQEPKVSA